MGKGTYGSQVGRPPAKKNKPKTNVKTSLKGLKVGSPAYMQVLRNRKKK